MKLLFYGSVKKCDTIELRLASSLIEKRERLWKADIDDNDNREKKHEKW